MYNAVKVLQLYPVENEVVGRSRITEEDAVDAGLVDTGAVHDIDVPFEVPVHSVPCPVAQVCVEVDYRSVHG